MDVGLEGVLLTRLPSSFYLEVRERYWNLDALSRLMRLLTPKTAQEIGDTAYSANSDG